MEWGESVAQGPVLRPITMEIFLDGVGSGLANTKSCGSPPEIIELDVLSQRLDKYTFDFSSGERAGLELANEYICYGHQILINSPKTSCLIVICHLRWRHHRKRTKSEFGSWLRKPGKSYPNRSKFIEQFEEYNVLKSRLMLRALGYTILERELLLRLAGRKKKDLRANSFTFSITI